MRISDWSSDVCSSDLHAQQLAGLSVEAARGVVAGIVNRLGHRRAVRQRLAQARCALRRRVGLRRQARRLLEDAVEVEAAEAGGLRQLLEARQFLGLGDEATGFRHRGGIAAYGGRHLRPAALAGPEACRFRLGRALEEADVLTPRLARPTGPRRSEERRSGNEWGRSG